MSHEWIRVFLGFSSPHGCLEAEGSWWSGSNGHTHIKLGELPGRGYEDGWNVQASGEDRTVDRGGCKVDGWLFSGRRLDHV